jgi:hypothetical protein
LWNSAKTIFTAGVVVPSCSLRNERDTGRIESFERPVQVTDGAREPFDVIENKNEILAERVGF